MQARYGLEWRSTDGAEYVVAIASSREALVDHAQKMLKHAYSPAPGSLGLLDRETKEWTPIRPAPCDCSDAVLALFVWYYEARATHPDAWRIRSFGDRLRINDLVKTQVAADRLAA